MVASKRQLPCLHSRVSIVKQRTPVSEPIIADTLKKLDGFIEMSTGDIQFLAKMLRDIRVEKALEVGVSAGGSSALLLSLFPRDANTALYAVDYYCSGN